MIFLVKRFILCVLVGICLAKPQNSANLDSHTNNGPSSSSVQRPSDNIPYAQQGIPTYQYPYPLTGLPNNYGYGYPYPGKLGYSQNIGYPQQGLVIQQGDVVYPPITIRMGYPRNIGDSLGGGGMGYPQGLGYPQSGNAGDPYANIKTEIIDVSPEYQRQLLGLPEEYGKKRQGKNNNKPRFNVKVDSQSQNITSIPANLTKPIITKKSYSTIISRTFVYNPSKPINEIKPINLHFINGKEVTNSAKDGTEENTTENEDVEETSTKNYTVNKQGRRYMDVPSSCPEGTLVAHNGKCIEPFRISR